MKICILSIGLTIVFFQTQAQEFKRLKLGLGSGVAILAGNKGSSELFYLEPGYRISDELTLNVRWESAFIMENNRNYENTMEALNSYSVNGQYFFGTRKVRPFAGLGLGLFKIPTYKAELTGAGISFGYAHKLDLYPRIGFELGHFTLSVDYNFVPATREEEIGMIGFVPVIFKSKVSNEYIGFRIGFHIGGGHQSKSDIKSDDSKKSQDN